MQIESVQTHEVRNKVDVVSAFDVYVVTDVHGGSWAWKKISSEQIAVGAAVWLLAKALGVPVPRAATPTGEKTDGWMLEWVQGSHWDLQASQALANLDDVGALVALDAITHNTDRHSGNLLITTDDHGHRVLCVIDLDGAEILAHATGCSPPAPNPFTEGLDARALRPGAMRVAAAAQRLTEGECWEFAHAACRAGRCPGLEDALCDALFARCSNAISLVEQHLDMMEG